MMNFKILTFIKKKNFWLFFLSLVVVIVLSVIFFSSTLHIYLVDSFFERNMHGIARVPKYIKERYEKFPAFMRRSYENMIKEKLNSDNRKERSKAIGGLKRFCSMYPEWRYNAVIGYQKEDIFLDMFNLDDRCDCFVNGMGLERLTVAPSKAREHIDFLLYGFNSFLKTYGSSAAIAGVISAYHENEPELRKALAPLVESKDRVIVSQVCYELAISNAEGRWNMIKDYILLFEDPKQRQKFQDILDDPDTLRGSWRVYLTE